MESLALLVTVILLVTISLGPISVVLSRLESPAARIFGYISGALGIAAGVLLLTSVGSTGGRFIGIVSAAAGGLGLYLNFKRRAS